MPTPKKTAPSKASAQPAAPLPELSQPSGRSQAAPLIKAVVLISLLGVFSNVSELALSPVFGGIPSAVWHPYVLMVGCFIGWASNLALRRSVPLRAATLLPVVALSVLAKLAFDQLGTGFNGEALTGDCTDRDILEQAGIQRADGLFAVTRSDNANLMTVEIATHLYDVPRTIARLLNPEREVVYRKLGVRYVSSTNTIAKLFLNEFREESYPLHVEFIDSEVALVAREVDTGGHAMPVEEFAQAGLLRIAAVRRGARVFIPDRSDRLERDDVVTAAMKPSAHRRLSTLVREPFDRDRAREA
jgi:trk system potassium uptake protein